MKHIKLKISKKAGFWRYKVEVELDLQPQPQAPYIKATLIEGYYGIAKTEIREDEYGVFLAIADSVLYLYESPDNNNFVGGCILCYSEYLVKPCQRKIEFYLEHDVNINEIINAFKDLDDKIDRMVQAPGTPAFNCSQIGTKHIKLKVFKKAGFWRYKVEVELDLQFQPQAPYIKGINIKGKGYSKVITKTGIREEYDSVDLEIADSDLYQYEDPTEKVCEYLYCLCCSTYLTEPYQRKIEFYLEYNINIDEVINIFKDFDDKIDKMVQAPGTPAFNCSQIGTKHIKLKIFKKAGFWRYKLEVELDLQPQPQAPYIKEVSIKGKGYSRMITKTGIREEYDSVVLEIADSDLYQYEDPTKDSCEYLYRLCCSTYLTKPYQRKIEFYLEYNVNINEIINIFKDLDDRIDKMVQVPGTPAFNCSQIGTKYIELRIFKRVGFWRYKVEIELDLQSQPQASYIKGVVIRGKGCGIIKTEVVEEYDLIVLKIADSDLYWFEDPTKDSCEYLCCLCCSTYLTKPYQQKIEFYLEYNVNINEVINIFKDLDDRIGKMVQAPGTPAFNCSQIGTKYIKLRIFKKAGFWRYKVEVELDLQSQPQASYIKGVVIRGKGYGIIKTEVVEECDLIVLKIADSKLYRYENPTNSSCDYSYSLCCLTYLTRPYQEEIEFYLEYNVNINEIINAFKSLDNEIGKMVQAPGTPAFDYFLNEAKYIKLRISKRAGFWRYKVEVELNLQPQSQASYIERINIEGHYETIKMEVDKRQGWIVLRIADSRLYHYEDPTNGEYNCVYSLCPPMYLVRPYQRKIEFYLEYDVSIDEVIDVFRNLDNEIDRMVQATGTPAFNYLQTGTKHTKLKISKKAGFWRYKVEFELDLQPQLQASYIKEITIRGKDSFEIIETGIEKKYGSIILEIADSKLYRDGDLMCNDYTSEYNLCSSIYLTKPYQRKVEFYLEYNVDINKVIDAFRNFDDEIDKMVQVLGTPAFSYFQTGTKYIELNISKRAGFWRYKVKVELNLQFQLQALHINKISIKGMNYRITKTGTNKKRDSIILRIANSKLYCCEDPADDSYTDSYNLYPPAQKEIEFYLRYDIDINEIINAFKNLDDIIDQKIQTSNTFTSN